jgi:2,3-bisphosphoglycerate-independent phosphoglycerate mutase
MRYFLNRFFNERKEGFPMKGRIRFKSLVLVLLAALMLTAIIPGPMAFSAHATEASNGKRPTVLLILDGFGLRDETEHNAIALADTPVLDRLMKECPFVKGNASGLAVGLPEGQMGSSEVGHLNIGAGRIVYQDLVRITKSIEDDDFFENEALLKAVNNAKEKGTSLHIYGLLSDGGVHSHNTHLYALLELAKRHGLEKVYVHCFTDGRDTPPESGKDYIQELQDKMDSIGCGKIATVGGRYYAMDRDNHWDRVEKAYRAMTLGEGVTANSALEAVTQSYAKGETDEFIQPTVVMEDGAPVATIGDGDSIIFFNYRPDRAREITRTFCCDEFDGFDRGPRKQVTYVCFTDYDVTIPNKAVAFDKQTIVNTLGEWLAANGKKQARIAETEKYAHVTFFFNGGVEAPNEGEDRFLIPSPEVATYDLQPEMSAPQVCDTLIEKIQSGEYDIIITNFANSDMVGHTGVEAATIEAIACLDACIGRVVEAVEAVNGQLFICADHGNAEMMVNPETGDPLTAHTTNPVPFILVNYDPAYTLREGGCLADIAPTLLEMMGMEKPAEMTGESLLVKETPDN